jgi:integrase
MVSGSKCKTGQAPALSVKNWARWLEWLLHTAGPRIYLVVMLTGAFGLRCSEALALKREDICLDADLPKIKITGDSVGARKSPGDVYVRKQHLKLMKDHLKNGIQVDRQRGHKHGKGKKNRSVRKTCFVYPCRAIYSKPVRIRRLGISITMRCTTTSSSKLPNSISTCAT